jgi:hypothetical protein
MDLRPALLKEDAAGGRERWVTGSYGRAGSSAARAGAGWSGAA